MIPEFRVWNGQEFDYCTLRARNGFSPQENGIWYDLIQTHPEDIIFGTLEIKGEEEIEQYTGLKDKNGNKIFEGDIVSISNHPFQKHKGDLTGIDIEGNYEINWSERDLTWLVGMWKCSETRHYLTVIGNIHEDGALIDN